MCKMRCSPPRSPSRSTSSSTRSARRCAPSTRTFFQAPGRMNVYDEHPFKVIFDYAHNAHAVGAMADLARRLDVRGRRIVVVAGPGDRRDEDIRAIAASSGRTLRSLYLPPRRQSARPRRARSAAMMLAQSLRERGVPDERDRGHSRRAGGHRRRAAHGPAGRFAAGVRRCAHPFLEADHQIQAGARTSTRPPRTGRCILRPRAMIAPPPDGGRGGEPRARRCSARGARIRARGARLRFVGEAAD